MGDDQILILLPVEDAQATPTQLPATAKTVRSAAEAVELLETRAFRLVLVHEGVAPRDGGPVLEAARARRIAALVVHDPPLPDVHRRPQDNELRLRRLARECVGTVLLPRVLGVAREAMLAEALERAGGNKTVAGSMIGISRQRMQSALSTPTRAPPTRRD